jgi:hypothetical protein
VFQLLLALPLFRKMADGKMLKLLPLSLEILSFLISLVMAWTVSAMWVLL